MSINEIIIISGFGLTVIGSIVKTQYAITKDIKSLTDDLASKRQRIYERIDEEKIKSDNKYTSKEICVERHEQIKATLLEMRDDIKKLIRMGNGKGDKYD